MSSIQGQSQKGPFQPGGNALARSLNADGSPGGAEVTGSIDTDGAYELGDIDWTGPTEIVMEGTFYNEVSGSFSSGSRTLTAVTDLASGESPSVNVNIFTYFTAERARTLMSTGAGFDAALAQARQEIRTVLDLSGDPAELNLLETIGGVENDSANLLMFSAAVLDAGIDQAGLDQMAADFADDGDFNGRGAGELAAVENAADAELLSNARGNLQSQYGTTPPDISGPGDIAWQLSPCASAKLSEPRVFCGEEVFHGTKGDDEDEPILYYPSADAYHALSMVGDAAIGTLSGWTLYGGTSFGGVEYGSSDNASPYEDTTELDLAEGHAYNVHVFLPSEDALASDGFELRAWPVNEGAAHSPIELFVGGTHSGRVGHLFVNGTAGGPATSWYYFRSTGGEYRIRVHGYAPDGGSGGLQIDVYEGIVNYQTAIGTLSDLPHVGEADSSGGGSNEVTVELDADWPYFVLITNEFTDSRRTSFRPEAGWAEFDLTVTTVSE